MAGRYGSLRCSDFSAATAILLLGNDPTSEQHPGLAWQIRTNVRPDGARLYVANHKQRSSSAVRQTPPCKFPKIAGTSASSSGSPAPPLLDEDSMAASRDAIGKEESLVIIFGSEYRGRDIDALVNFGLGLPERHLRSPRRLRQLPRCRGHGGAARLAARLRPGHTRAVPLPRNTAMPFPQLLAWIW